MTAQELRIGNILREKYTSDKLVVSELTKDRITFDYITTEKWQAEPIPLTEEILLKCGFEIVGYGRYHSLEFKGFRKGLYDVFLLENGSITFMDNVFEKLITSVKYVHQLQNLYHALTGTEMEVNI